MRTAASNDLAASEVVAALGMCGFLQFPTCIRVYRQLSGVSREPSLPGVAWERYIWNIFLGLQAAAIGLHRGAQ